MDQSHHDQAGHGELQPAEEVIEDRLRHGDVPGQRPQRPGQGGEIGLVEALGSARSLGLRRCETHEDDGEHGQPDRADRRRRCGAAPVLFDGLFQEDDRAGAEQDIDGRDGKQARRDPRDQKGDPGPQPRPRRGQQVKPDRRDEAGEHYIKRVGLGVGREPYKNRREGEQRHRAEEAGAPGGSGREVAERRQSRETGQQRHNAKVVFVSPRQAVQQLLAEQPARGRHLIIVERSQQFAHRQEPNIESDEGLVLTKRSCAEEVVDLRQGADGDDRPRQQGQQAILRRPRQQPVQNGLGRFRPSCRRFASLGHGPPRSAGAYRPPLRATRSTEHSYTQRLYLGSVRCSVVCIGFGLRHCQGGSRRDEVSASDHCDRRQGR
ncbi:hypothetical protein D3C87_1130520 [compost metagenome]